MSDGSYKHLAANASTLISDHPCTLMSVTINTAGSAGNTLNIYDAATTASTSSTNLVAAISTVVTASPPSNYECLLNTGLVAVMATGGAADVTIVWH